jgi:hypothetical protein
MKRNSKTCFRIFKAGLKLDSKQIAAGRERYDVVEKNNREENKGGTMHHRLELEATEIALQTIIYENRMDVGRNPPVLSGRKTMNLLRNHKTPSKPKNLRRYNGLLFIVE